MAPLPCVDVETVAGFVEGRLAAAAMGEVELHASTCATCQALLAAALRSATLPEPTETPSEAPWEAPWASREPLRRGSVLGRYTILELTGRGAMGEVYAAYDGELDRRVALKLLHAHGSSGDARANARLLREARAMARVSHANVVAVHEAGTFAGRTFIAMEFVEGGTLKKWLAGGTRARGDILEKFAMAARGLAAAHAAGLVHRDFKPQNVMIGADGAARVTDFGLVAALGEVGSEAAEVGVDVETLARSPSTLLHLTRTGELLGTPLYMAPEQFRAAPADARSDQFSFCVALYQALYGAPPFGDVSLGALVRDVLAGRVHAAPAGSTVPTWLRRVVLRGLSLEPTARWPSMRDVVAALGRDPARARRQRGLVVGAAVLVALSAGALARRTREPTAICRGGPSALADVWDAPAPATNNHRRREAIRAAFLGSGAPGAGEVWERVTAELDRFAGRWLATHRDACEATNVRHEQSATLLDLRMSCLGERRTALAALTDVFTRADRDVVRNAVDAVNALPSLDRCSDPRQLATSIEPPRDETTRARVEDIRRRAATAKALDDAGKHEEARRVARPLVVEARALGYAPLTAEILTALARTTTSFGPAPELVATREEAFWTSIAAGRFAEAPRWPSCCGRTPRPSAPPRRAPPSGPARRTRSSTEWATVTLASARGCSRTRPSRANRTAGRARRSSWRHGRRPSRRRFFPWDIIPTSPLRHQHRGGRPRRAGSYRGGAPGERAGVLDPRASLRRVGDGGGVRPQQPRGVPRRARPPCGGAGAPARQPGPPRGSARPR